MNHPSREEWMGLLYEEIDSAQKNELDSHLRACAACQENVARWRGAMAAMSQWKLPDSERPGIRQGWFRWAAAAVLFLAVGISIGAGISRANTIAMRNDLQSQRAAIDELTRTISENRARDQQALVATLRELETRRAAEIQTLRRDLETVATLTEESLNRAQNQLVRLAGYTSAR